MKVLNWILNNWVVKNKTLDEIEAWQVTSQF